MIRVASARSQRKIMHRSQNHSPFARQVLKYFHKRKLMGRIQRGCWFIGNQNWRFLRQSARDENTGAFSARKRANHPLAQVLDIHALQCALNGVEIGGCQGENGPRWGERPSATRASTESGHATSRSCAM